MRYLKKAIVAVALCVAVALVCLGAALAYGLADILVSNLDDRAGVLTSIAINAVAETPQGETTIGHVVAQERPNAKWIARHSDDDAWWSMRVTSFGPGDYLYAGLAPQWCVFLGMDWLPYPHIRVTEVAPGNRAGQLIAPALGDQYLRLPLHGQFYCSDVRWHQEQQRSWEGFR